jgi:hypothetical protein
MPTEGALVDHTTSMGLFVGADMAVEYTDTDEDMTGWTIVLDIRKADTSADPAKLSKTGVASGTYNVTPASNTQTFTFTLSDDDLAASVFPGDDWTGRYSIKRTDTGVEMPLRYGAVTITRVTQA